MRVDIFIIVVITIIIIIISGIIKMKLKSTLFIPVGTFLPFAS